MPNYLVASGDKDGETGSPTPLTGATTMRAYEAPSLGISYWAYATIDTSAIGTDTINDATIYWYQHSYTRSRGTAYSRLIYISGTQIFNSTATPSNGWGSHALTAGELVLINKVGETNCVFRVTDPGGANNRLWTLRAYEYSPTQTFAPYLAITHTATSGKKQRSFVTIIF